MDGLWRCANYAFAPNFLKFCGPDKNRELKGYLQFRASDAGLKNILSHFAAMHPYLKLIAHSNGIADEFNHRVVEAYWLGNGLLGQVSGDSFYRHIKPRLPQKGMKWFEPKLSQGAKPNHQFHVFNFIKRTGYKAVNHTLETMDQCRISWGRIVSKGKVKSQTLTYQKGRLHLKPAVKEFKNLVNNFKVGDRVALHWGWVCEKITQRQAKNLQFYTRLALTLANQTL